MGMYLEEVMERINGLPGVQDGDAEESPEGNTHCRAVTSHNLGTLFHPSGDKFDTSCRLGHVTCQVLKMIHLTLFHMRMERLVETKF